MRDCQIAYEFEIKYECLFDNSTMEDNERVCDSDNQVYNPINAYK